MGTSGTGKCIFLYDEHINTERCVQALLKSPDIFQREGDIVILSTYESKPQNGRQADKVWRIQLAEPDHLLDELSRHAQYLIPTGKGKHIRKHLPEKYASRVLKKSAHPYRILTGFVTTPTLRHDGRIIDTAGYDQETGIFFAPFTTYPDIPAAPGIDEARLAYEALQEPFENFKFAEPHHKSAAIAGGLSINTRHLVETCPAFAALSHTAGAGKGLTVDVACVIATGGTHPVSILPRDTQEAMNALYSIARAGARVTIFDNISGLFGNDALDAALTNPNVETRRFHTQNMVTSKLQNVFFMTGNNVRFRGDLGRRTVPIVLLPTVQNPELTTGFKHPKLVQWTRENHPRLLGCALTLLRAFLLAGAPSQSVTYGSFDDWNSLVRSCLLWVGAPDPFAGTAALQEESDTGLESLSQLLGAWHLVFPSDKRLTMSALVAAVKAQAQLERMNDPSFPVDEQLLDLGQALTAYDPASRGRISELNSRVLAQKMPLTYGKSRVARGLQLLAEATGPGGTREFWVVALEPAAPAAPTEPKDSDDTGCSYEPCKEDELPF